MSAVAKLNVVNEAGNIGIEATSLLGPTRERRLLQELADCKRSLTDALARDRGLAPRDETDDPRAMSRLIAESYASRTCLGGTLDSLFERYFKLRNELALANMRLVAYVAKPYRNRGVAYEELVQAGFCGLLEAIDRFDMGHQTKLSTYATWWIRQAVQSAVAEEAYPVCLSPRHLRQLAHHQDDYDRVSKLGSGRHETASESIRRIWAATQSPVSLNETGFPALSTTHGSDRDREADIDLNEAVDKWMSSLRPRQREVVSYRFGLGGSPRLSLSQVGKVLGVSKERVRQIQEAALEMLRSYVSCDLLIEST